MNKITNKDIYFKNCWHFIAQGFGMGRLPFAPGTFASLFALFFVPFLWMLPLQIYLSIVIIGFVCGIWLCRIVAKDLNSADPASIVWDEFVGVWLTFLLVPPSLMWLGVGFLLFRLFDIFKPFPIGYCDKRIKGGFGIMLDDVIAGGLSCLCLHGLIYLVNIL